MKNVLNYLIITLIIISNIFIPISAKTNLDPDNDGIPGLRGVDYDIVRVYVESNSTNNVYSPKEISPQIMSAYSIGNVRYLGICGPYSSPVGGETFGGPGVTLTLSTSVSISASISTSLGIGYNEISVGLGFQVQASYTLQISGAFTVPSTYNGKTVKRVKFSAHPYSKLYSYDFMYFGIKTGSGNAEIPWGISYEYVYYY